MSWRAPLKRILEAAAVACVVAVFQRLLDHAIHPVQPTERKSGGSAESGEPK